MIFCSWKSIMLSRAHHDPARSRNPTIHHHRFSTIWQVILTSLLVRLFCHLELPTLERRASRDYEFEQSHLSTLRIWFYLLHRFPNGSVSLQDRIRLCIIKLSYLRNKLGHVWRYIVSSSQLVLLLCPFQYSSNYHYTYRRRKQSLQSGQERSAQRFLRLLTAPLLITQPFWSVL